VRTCLLYIVIALVGSGLSESASAQGVTANSLVGTWKLVSAKYGGEDSTLTRQFTTIKHFTPTHFMWVSYGEDGNITRTAGGTYSYDGKTLEDTPMYGIGSDFNVVSKKLQTYECRVVGKKLYQKGALSNGRSLEEVWELVEK